jgi:2-haloalkanoic acid dehalogenase type II
MVEPVVKTTTRSIVFTWLRSLTGRYVDFFAVTEDALVFATNAMKLPLSADEKQHLLDAYLHLRPWPDTADALRRLRESGVRVIALANFSPAMLRSNAENAGLIGLFDALVSTNANHTYKPDRAHISWASTACISRSRTSCSRHSVGGMLLARSRSGIQRSG